MSLIKQLWLAIALILALASSGSFILSTIGSKHYFEEQLQTKNDDNATTLALSITQLPKDPVTIDLLLSAQFDTGHYQYIGLIDPNGNAISERIDRKSRTKAPAWFVKMVALDLYAGTADIQDGWAQYATLKIESNANFAYDKLWDATILIALWVVLIGLISGIACGQMLKKILRPLSDVVHQAKAIGESKFVMIDVPKTKEFRAVVNAMNALSNRVKKTVSEESARLDQLRFENNFDHITGLMNYDYFCKQLSTTISDEEYFHEGTLVICRISNLADIDRTQGYQETNALLRRIGNVLQKECVTHPELSAGRLSGTDFAILSSQLTDSYALGNSIKSLLKSISNDTPASLPLNLLTVSAHVTADDQAVALLGEVDKVLDSIGQTSNDGGIHVINQSELRKLDNGEQNRWLQLLTSALDNKRVKLEAYPVINQNGELIHNESPVRLQLEANGKWLCAGEFIAWATQFNLMHRLDELVLETAIDLLSKGAQPIGLNISSHAICNPAFVEKALALLKNSPNVAQHLYFEIPERGAFDCLPEFRSFCSQLKKLGCHIGIEHVGSRISRLGELHDIGLNYIKIDAAVIRDIDTNEANKALLRGLSMIAHSMGVIAIAEGVQTQNELVVLKQIGIDGMTGPGITLASH